MRIIDKSSINGKIIRSLGIGLGTLATLSNKRASYKFTSEIIKEVFGNKKTKNPKKYFYKLRDQKIIRLEKVGNEDRVFLTENGIKVLLRFNYEKIQIKQEKVWDRNFRMIIFDIPEKKKMSRNSLRNKIKEMGFVKFNDSVWVYPYPCQKEIDFIANYWNIGKYVQFALVKDLTNRERLEKHFNL